MGPWETRCEGLFPMLGRTDGTTVQFNGCLEGLVSHGAGETAVMWDVCNVQVISLLNEDFVSPRFPLVTQVGTFSRLLPISKKSPCSSNILLNIFYVWKDNIPGRPVLRLALIFFSLEKSLSSLQPQEQLLRNLGDGDQFPCCTV